MAILKRYSCVTALTATDCGPAALATAANHYGSYPSLASLRTLLRTSGRGTSLEQLESACHALGFDASAGKIRVDNLERLPLPAICHFNDVAAGHYVVLHKVSPRRLIIADPQDGLIHISRQDFAQRWSGYGVLLSPSATFKKHTAAGQPIHQLVAELRPHLLVSTLILLATSIATVLGYGLVVLLRVAIDHVIPSKNYSLLILATLLCCLAILIKATSSWIRGQLSRSVGKQIEKRLASSFLSKVLAYTSDAFDRSSPGEFYTRMSDISKLRQAVTSSILTAGLDVVLNVTALVIMLLLIPALAWIVLAYSASVALLMSVSLRGIMSAERRAKLDAGEFASVFVEMFSIIKSIKVAQAESYVAHHVSRAFEKQLKSGLFREHHTEVLSLAAGSLSGLASVAIVYTASVLAVQHALSIGTLILSYSIAAVFFSTSDRLLFSLATLFEGCAAAERLQDVHDTSQSAATVLRSERPEQAKEKAHLVLAKVSFCFVPEQQLITKCDLCVMKGQTIGIAGQTGVGKSTLLALCAGLLTPRSGSIYLDGVDLRTLEQRELRSRIGMVFQESAIVRGTIRDNIDLGWGAFEKDIQQAAYVSDIDGFVQSLPSKYETVVSYQGGSLSSGQKQRIALARMMLRKPEVLILDEATSNLDLETEKRVMTRLLEARIGLTTIVVSHRPSVLQLMDRQLSVDKGVIHELRNILATNEVLAGRDGRVCAEATVVPYV